MADIVDVENALIEAIAQALLPNGATFEQDVVFASALGDAIRIGRIFPPQNIVTSDTSRGTQEIGLDGRVISSTCCDEPPCPTMLDHGDTCIVVVQAASGMSRDETRHFREWTQVSTTPITLTVNPQANVITFEGVGGTGQVAAISYDNQFFAHRLTMSDTPATVAMALAALIPGAALDNATVTITQNEGPVGALVFADATVIQELGRRGQVFRITILAPDPLVRDTVGNAVEVAMGEARLFYLPDGSTTLAPVFNGSFHTEASEDASMWRRDLTYRVEYSVTQSVQLPTYAFGAWYLNGATKGYALP